MKAKELEEERNRLQKTNAAQHTQLDKYKKISEDRQSFADSLETQVSALKKVRLLTTSLLQYVGVHFLTLGLAVLTVICCRHAANNQDC